MNTLPLWQTLAAKRDPETSKAAARAIAPVIPSEQEYALACVERMPGATAKELDTHFNPQTWNRIQRRLNELERKGLVERCAARPCRISGKVAATWRVKP